MDRKLQRMINNAITDAYKAGRTAGRDEAEMGIRRKLGLVFSPPTLEKPKLKVKMVTTSKRTFKRKK